MLRLTLDPRPFRGTFVVDKEALGELGFLLSTSHHLCQVPPTLCNLGNWQLC